MMVLSHCFGIIVVACLISVTRALSDVKVIIPIAVKRGDRAVLRCHYDLEGDLLYSAKWYKRGREFYRYTPRENPPIKEFPIKGLTVLESYSNATHVVLDNVSLENSGPYSCEISADAPSFYTGIQTAVLQVVEVPREDPQIKGVKLRYRLGDTLKAECTSGNSTPPANLTWLVNDTPVEKTKFRHSRKSENNGMYSAHSALRLPINQQLFSGGQLKIRCVASLHNVYHRSSEKSVALEKQKHRPLIISTTTSSSLSTIGWEYALAAERYPQSTLIFSSESINGSPCIATSIKTLSILIVLVCTR